MHRALPLLLYRALPLLLCGCHLFDDGLIAQSCEDLDGGCLDTSPEGSTGGSTGGSTLDSAMDTAEPIVRVSWEVTDFGHDVFLVQAGWEAGYPVDSWYAWEGVALPLTDDGFTDEKKAIAYVYGSGESPDNWVLHEGKFATGEVRTTLLQTDDDACGVIIGHSDSSFALLGASADRLPPPMFETKTPTAFLFRVVDGTVVDSVSWPLKRWGGEDSHPVSLVLTQREGELIGSVDGQEMRLASEPMLGRAGLWAYESGNIVEQPVSCSFFEVAAQEE